VRIFDQCKGAIAILNRKENLDIDDTEITVRDEWKDIFDPQVGEEFVEQLHAFLIAHSFDGQALSDGLAMRILNRPDKSISNPIVGKYPNFIPAIYTNLALQANVYTSDSAGLLVAGTLYKSQSMPVLAQVSVSMSANSKTLEDMLVRVLTMSIAGYQFLQPRTYYDLNNRLEPAIHWTIRWIQGWFLLDSFLVANRLILSASAVNFMPSVYFPVSAKVYQDKPDQQAQLESVMKDCLELRRKLVIPLIENLTTN